MVAGVAVPGVEVEAVAAPGMEVKEMTVAAPVMEVGEVAAPAMEVLVEVVAVMMAANGADIKLTKTKAVEKWSFVKSW